MQQWSFTGCVCVCVCVCVCACALSRVQPFVTPRTVTHQASLSMGFPRQESWSGLPFPTPGNLPNPGMEPRSPALAGGFSATEPPGKPKFTRGHQCTLPDHPPSPSPTASNVHSLCLRVYSCPANSFICTLFYIPKAFRTHTHLWLPVL